MPLLPMVRDALEKHRRYGVADEEQEAREGGPLVFTTASGAKALEIGLTRIP